MVGRMHSDGVVVWMIPRERRRTFRAEEDKEHAWKERCRIIDSKESLNDSSTFHASRSKKSFVQHHGEVQSRLPSAFPSRSFSTVSGNNSSPLSQPTPFPTPPTAPLFFS